jgi:hypothetical protein
MSIAQGISGSDDYIQQSSGAHTADTTLGTGDSERQLHCLECGSGLLTEFTTSLFPTGFCTSEAITPSPPPFLPSSLLFFPPSSPHPPSFLPSLHYVARTGLKLEIFLP